MRIKGVCFGWETTTPPARNEGECRRSKSSDARAQGSGTGLGADRDRPRAVGGPVTPHLAITLPASRRRVISMARARARARNPRDVEFDPMQTTV